MPTRPLAPATIVGNSPPTRPGTVTAYGPLHVVPPSVDRASAGCHDASMYATYTVPSGVTATSGASETEPNGIVWSSQCRPLSAVERTCRPHWLVASYSTPFASLTGAPWNAHPTP